MIRRAAAGGVVVALLLTLSPAPASAGPGSVRWTPCAAGFDCASVSVPLDHDRPRGEQITIALTRMRATDPQRRLGSLLVNPGGPGLSGVAFARTNFGDLPAELQARFDLVGFDSRGLAGSTALRCYESAEQAGADRAPFHYPETPAEENVWRQADDKMSAACTERGAPIVDHMSSAEVARDLERLRIALGDRKLTYLGYSYGSLLGQTYANLFPDNFRALVIDGVIDPVVATRGPAGAARTTPTASRMAAARGAGRTLAEFFRVCDAAGSACDFSGRSSARFARLADRLRAGPVDIVDPSTGATRTFRYNDLIGTALGAIFNAAGWPALARFLAGLESQLESTGPRVSIKAVPEEYPNEGEGKPGVACSDTVNPRSFAVWQDAADRAEREYGYFARIYNWVWSQCRSWPASAGQDSYHGPWTGTHGGDGADRRQLLRPGHPVRGCRGRGPAAPQFAAAVVRGMGSCCLSPAGQRLRGHTGEPLPADREATGAGHGVPTGPALPALTGAVSGVEVEEDPAALGFVGDRMAAIDRHFRRYVDDGLLPGWQIVVTRHGRVAHSSVYGQRDLAAGTPVEADTLWRIFSMTKPITSVAAMTLWEEGRFQLTDEISRWLPAFADMRVYDRGSALKPYTVPAAEPIRVWHLLSHTAGLTYGFMHTSVVDQLYRNAGLDVTDPALDLATTVDRYAQMPLLFQPGTAWGYSVATDVLARLVEVVAGQDFDTVLTERVLTPLKMTGVRRWVTAPDATRLATLYAADPTTGRPVPAEEPAWQALRPPELRAGGHGLICTAADYHRFTQMLLNGGELDGRRVLGSRTVRLMTRNHLPGGQDLAALSTGGFAETSLEGVGFGLGFAVTQDPVPGRSSNNAGEFSWGGLASTTFWVDPVDRVTALFFTQLMPSSTYPLRQQLGQLVYSALAAG
ncbi:beta-lactamase [Actinoplanes friuliensis DSM 7358]|uniref:Beta-lactamase n=1 Tax=Actinoplanes friuliensis DSM 7358 TaxID=1246995 RepID=U5VVP7_9ACTN|nr:alpha/beta fold hydrolase [Actinoplanes friuliensis]AGZ40887.1 beta-lactamase [Actinoplanes friuliensis DSM 7358]